MKKGETRMNNSKQLAQELHDLAKPLSDWLYLHGNPHSMIVVTQANVELLTGEMAAPFELKD